MPGEGREIFVEFIRAGQRYVKVTAIDSDLGVGSASIVGPATAPQAVLAEAARRKLEYLAPSDRSK